MKKQSNKYVVQQSNALIETSQTLTIVERRLIYHILSRVNPQRQQQSYEIRIEDFAEDFPQMGRGTIYDQVKGAIEKLWQREIVFIDENNKVTKIRWFSLQQYQDKQAFLKISFSNEVMPLIFDLRQKYTSMLLENFKSLDSVYSLRLYELLCQYKTTGRREETIDKLRFFLDCTETNKEFKFFRLRVIEPAIQEINAKSNLLINKVEYIRKNRKVHSIKFEFCDKALIKNVEVQRQDIEPMEKQVRIKDEPKLKRYHRPNTKKATSRPGDIEDQGLQDATEEAVRYMIEFARENHMKVFATACENLKTISNYEQETGNRLSPRLYNAKVRAQSKLGEYYSNAEAYFFKVEELDEVKNKILYEDFEGDDED